MRPTTAGDRGDGSAGRLAARAGRAAARSDRLRASRGGGDGASTVADTALGLLDAARGLEKLDDAPRPRDIPRRARTRRCTRADSAHTAARSSWPNRPAMRRRAATAAADDLLLDGLAMRFTDGHAASLPTLRSALTQLLDAAQRTDGDVMRSFWQGFPIAQECAAGELWDDDLWHDLATTAVRLAREAGALAVLPLALATRAGVPCVRGRIRCGVNVDRGGRRDRRGDRICAGAVPRVVAGRLARQEAEAMRLIDAAAERAASPRRRPGRRLDRCLPRCSTTVSAATRRRCARRSTACEHEDLGRSDVALSNSSRRPSAAASARRREALARLRDACEPPEQTGPSVLWRAAARCSRTTGPRRTSTARRSTARAHPDRVYLARAPGLRRVAAARAPAGGRARAAGHRARDVRPDGGGGLRRTRATRAPGHRRKDA